METQQHRGSILNGKSTHCIGTDGLERVDLQIRPGEIVGLIGPNGSGKSTLVNVISCFYRPDAGELVFDGRRVNGAPPNKLRRGGMSRTFQNLRLYDELTVLDNLLIGLHLDYVGGGLADWNWIPALLQMPAARRQDRDRRNGFRRARQPRSGGID